MQSEGGGRGDVESSKHLERKTKAGELRRNTRLRASVSGCVGVLCVHMYVSVCARACVCVCARTFTTPVAVPREGLGEDGIHGEAAR